MAIRRPHREALGGWSGGEFFDRDHRANVLFDSAVAKGVPHRVSSQFIGDRRHDHALVDGQDARRYSSRSDIHRILKSQRSVNRREFLGKGAEIGEGLVRGVPQSEERCVRGDNAVDHSARMRCRGGTGSRIEFVAKVTLAKASQGLHSINLVSALRAGGGGETPEADAGLLQPVFDLRPGIEPVIEPPTSRRPVSSGTNSGTIKASNILPPQLGTIRTPW